MTANIHPIKLYGCESSAEDKVEYGWHKAFYMGVEFVNVKYLYSLTLAHYDQNLQVGDASIWL